VLSWRLISSKRMFDRPIDSVAAGTVGIGKSARRGTRPGLGMQRGAVLVSTSSHPCSQLQNTVPWSFADTTFLIYRAVNEKVAHIKGERDVEMRYYHQTLNAASQTFMGGDRLDI